jgi:hypothetical protein
MFFSGHIQPGGFAFVLAKGEQGAYGNKNRSKNDAGLGSYHIQREHQMGLKSFLKKVKSDIKKKPAFVGGFSSC